MRICFVHKDIANIERGGVSALYKNLIKGLQEISSSIEIYVITQNDFDFHGVTTIKAPNEKDKLKHSMNVCKILEAIHADIAECSSWGYELLEYSKSPIKTAKIVVRLEPTAKTLFNTLDYHKYEEELINNSDLLIAVSEFAKHDCLKNYSTNKKVVVVSNCIDIKGIQEFKSVKNLTAGYRKVNDKWVEFENFPIENLLRKTSMNIFWVGKQTKMKGFDTLEKIVKNSPRNFNFIINLGWADEFVLWDNNYPNCSFVKGLKRDEQISLWRSMDAFLNTSRVEGFGLVILESAANKVPIVASKDCAVYEEYFDPSWGVVKSFENISKVISVLSNIKDSKFTFENLEKFSLASYIDKNLRLYRNLI